ncbi:MAG: hypothetical protein G01um101413_28 [Parcubacteria group bacterium Gr01-1014_13]|nr:MAG: hypothetical protein G01um101413_28 [Parcubacteria group bacterium Gr01-1014_13]
MKDGEILLRHRDQIPDKYSKNILLFPMWKTGQDGKEDGRIRGMNKQNVTWWCVTAYPDVRDWDNTYRLVRFSNLQLT